MHSSIHPFIEQVYPTLPYSTLLYPTLSIHRYLAHTVIPSPLAEVEAGGGGVGHDVATDGLLVITLCGGGGGGGGGCVCEIEWVSGKCGV